MHHCNAAGIAEQRVRVCIRRLPVSRPAGVPYADSAKHFFAAVHLFIQHFQAALCLDHLEPFSCVQHCQTRRVISSVFHASQPLQQDGSGFLLTDKTDNTTHIVFLLMLVVLVGRLQIG